MNETEPGFDCPECSARLYGDARRCHFCKWERKREPAGPGVEARSCWTCDECRARTPGQPVLYDPQDGRALCSSCHFQFRIRPFASRPTDLCEVTHSQSRLPGSTGPGTAPCADEAHTLRAPHHHVGQHIAEYRTSMARLELRAERIAL